MTTVVVISKKQADRQLTSLMKLNSWCILAIDQETIWLVSL